MKIEETISQEQEDAIASALSALSVAVQIGDYKKANELLDILQPDFEKETKIKK